MIINRRKDGQSKDGSRYEPLIYGRIVSSGGMVQTPDADGQTSLMRTKGCSGDSMIGTGRPAT